MAGIKGMYYKQLRIAKEPGRRHKMINKLNFSRSVHTLGDLEGRVSGLDFAATQTKSQAEVVRSYLGVPAKSENVHDNAAK